MQKKVEYLQKAINFPKRHFGGKNVLNEKEVLILSNLRKNARKPLSEISRDTNIPTSTVHDKVTRFEKSLITNHTSLVDFNKLGYHGKAMVAIRLNSENKEEAIDFLSNHSNVNSVYRLHDGYDVLFECVFKNMHKVDQFAGDLGKRFAINETKVFYITEDVLRENFLSEAEHYGGDEK